MIDLGMPASHSFLTSNLSRSIPGKTGYTGVIRNSRRVPDSQASGISRRLVLLGATSLLDATPVKLPRRIRLGLIGLEGHPSLILNPLPNLPDVELVAISEDGSSEPEVVIQQAPLAGA